MTESKADGTPKAGGKKESGLTPIQMIAAAASDLEHDRLGDAIAAMRKLLADHPNHLGGLEILARAHWRSGHHEEALDALRHLIRLNPYEPGYQFMAAGAHQALGHYAEAIRAYARCLESGGEAMRDSATLAIRELEAWQESVIADLLKSDRGFRAEYGRAPMEACRRRGFEFMEAPDGPNAPRTAESPQISVWERPS